MNKLVETADFLIANNRKDLAEFIVGELAELNCQNFGGLHPIDLVDAEDYWKAICRKYGVPYPRGDR